MKIADIEIEIERKPIKNMHLSVYPPHGRVHISVPDYLNDNDIQAYVESKWDWVLQRRTEIIEQARQTDREYVSGEDHYLFGIRYRLKIVPITSGAYKVDIKGNTITMSIAAASTAERRRELMQEFYREKLKAYLTDLIEHWQQQLHEPHITWKIKLMKTRWGSCSLKKRCLLFNLALARVPKECIEYVVVHELTHLKTEHHNKLFERLLTQRLPNWSTRRRRLNEFIALPMQDTGEPRNAAPSAAQ